MGWKYLILKTVRLMSPDFKGPRAIPLGTAFCLGRRRSASVPVRRPPQPGDPATACRCSKCPLNVARARTPLKGLNIDGESLWPLSPRARRRSQIAKTQQKRVFYELVYEFLRRAELSYTAPIPEPVRIKIEPDDIKEPEPNKFKEKLKNPEISIEKGADGVTISIKDGEDKKSTIKLKTGDADVQLTSKDFIWSEPKKRPNLNAKGQFPGGKYQLGTKHGGDKDVPLFIFCDPDKDECRSEEHTSELQ